MFSYQFPAIKGIQAKDNYYICMVPMKLLPKIFDNTSEYVPPVYRAQRMLNVKRIPEIKNYILDNRDTYVFSALSASIDGDFKFVPTNGDSIGILEIELDANFLIIDGQHRKAAIIQALEEDETLKDETISIVFFEDKGLVRSQQMFTDLNKHAVTTTRSINTLFESRDPDAMLAKKMVASIDFFKQYTDLESDNLGDNSPNLFTLSMFLDAINLIAGSINIKDNHDLEDFVIEYWKELEKNINPWQEFKNKDITKKILRKHYIVVYGVTILAFGKLGNWFYTYNRNNFKDTLLKLSQIDWRRSNIQDWQNRAVKQNGKINRSNETINLTYIRIKKLLGIKLSQEEKTKDKLASRR